MSGRMKQLRIAAAAVLIILPGCTSAPAYRTGPAYYYDDGPPPLYVGPSREERKDWRDYRRWLEERTTTYGVGSGRRGK